MYHLFMVSYVMETHLNTENHLNVFRSNNLTLLSPLLSSDWSLGARLELFELPDCSEHTWHNRRYMAFHG